MVNGTEPAKCACFPLEVEHHDWLLSFEARGLAGAMELFQHFKALAEEGSEDGELAWVDFPDFVSRHNWQDANAVSEFARLVDDAIRDRRAETYRAGLICAAGAVLSALDPIDVLRITHPAR
jgi:hypothetical protein